MRELKKPLPSAGEGGGSVVGAGEVDGGADA